MSFGGTQSGYATPFESEAGILSQQQSMAPMQILDKYEYDNGLNLPADPPVDEKRAKVTNSFFGWRSKKEGDVESSKSRQRPTRLFAPIYNGIGAGLGICMSLITLGPALLLSLDFRLYG